MGRWSLHVAQVGFAGIAPMQPDLVATRVVAGCAIVAAWWEDADSVQVRAVRLVAQRQIRELGDAVVSGRSPVAAA